MKSSQDKLENTLPCAEHTNDSQLYLDKQHNTAKHLMHLARHLQS